MPSRINMLRAQERSMSRGPSRARTGSPSSREASPARASTEKELVTLKLSPGSEVPSVPYKLRFVLSGDEWDERLDCITKHREHAARPLLEAIYFFFAMVIPAAVGYPIYLALMKAVPPNSTQQKPQLNAALVASTLSLLIFMLLTTPLFLRKYVLQRRLNMDISIWAEIDKRKVEDPKTDLRWKVGLPRVFQKSCRIIIPVPPRTDSEKNRTLSTMPTLPYDKTQADEVGSSLSRTDSISSKSMFEDD